MDSPLRSKWRRWFWICSGEKCRRGRRPDEEPEL